MRKLLFVLAALPALAFARHASADDGYYLYVPLYGQQQDQWCWAATGEMIMVYLHRTTGKGLYPSQCEEANHRFNRNDCCNNPSSCNSPGWPDFGYYNYNYRYTDSGAISSAEIRNQIFNNHIPVAFSWQWNGGGGHMMAAVGWSHNDQDGTDWVLINDPWPVGKGEQRWVTYDEYVGGSNYNHVHWRDFYGMVGVR